MTLLALIRDNEIVSIVRAGGWADLPGVGCVSPAQDGWEGEGYRLAAVTEPETPEGKQIVSGPTYKMIEGVPTAVYQYEDIPAERVRIDKTTVHERLIAAGKMDAAYAALMQNSTYFARWFAPGHTYVYADDPDAIALLLAIGADPDVILAPEA